MGLLVIAVVWCFFSPQFTDVGYRPHQPVAFSHKLHAGELQIDCRYCHATVEVSAVASIPPTQTCMNCHHLFKRDDPKLAAVRESAETAQPIHWLRVHKVPDFAYFNHSVHIRSGIGCSSCHGDVSRMDEITQTEPLSMSWCLDCHRRPDRYLRPPDQITNPAWTPSSEQLAFAREFKAVHQVDAPTDCTACHR
ncbi:MAG: cytochrome c3 family protein [Acidobacteriota bacterium]